MKRDIAIAGFVLTTEEWQALDPLSRAQLVVGADRRHDAWVVADVAGVLAHAATERDEPPT
jgi:hypothetical protein